MRSPFSSGTLGRVAALVMMQIVPLSLLQVKGEHMLLPLLLLHSLGAAAAPATVRTVAADPPVRV